MSSITPKNQKITATNKAWFPTPSANLTGTLTSTGKKVTGTGTAFRTDLCEGDYILNPTTDQIALVHRIESDTILFLESAFTADLSGATCKRIKSKHLKSMKVVFVGTGVGTIKTIGDSAAVDWPVGHIWDVDDPSCPINGPVLVTAGAANIGYVLTTE
jgi:hypothetical protein